MHTKYKLHVTMYNMYGNIGVYIYSYVCMYVRMYRCMYACMYIRTYVCMYVYARYVTVYTNLVYPCNRTNWKDRETW